MRKADAERRRDSVRPLEAGRKCGKMVGGGAPVGALRFSPEGYGTLRYTLLAAAVILADQATKYWVRLSVPSGASEPIIPGILHLTHVENTGAAFGLFQGYTPHIGRHHRGSPPRGVSLTESSNRKTLVSRGLRLGLVGRRGQPRRPRCFLAG